MPVPLSAMLAFGSSVGFDELAVTVSELTGVSASHTLTISGGMLARPRS